MTHICVSKLTILGPDNGLSPGRRQAIIWTNGGILLIGPLGTNFSEFLIVIQTFSFTKMHLQMSSAKWRPFCLGLNVLNVNYALLLSENKCYLKYNPLHSRVNLIHFKGAHLDPCEIYMMKLTCWPSWTLDCLLQYCSYIMQISLIYSYIWIHVYMI